MLIESPGRQGEDLWREDLCWIRICWGAQGRKVGQGKASDEIGRMVGHEAGFKKPDRHGGIRFYARIAGRVISESTGKIRSKNPGGIVFAEMVDTMDCGGNQFTRVALYSDAKNSI